MTIARLLKTCHFFPAPPWCQAVGSVTLLPWSPSDLQRLLLAFCVRTLEYSRVRATCWRFCEELAGKNSWDSLALPTALSKPHSVQAGRRPILYYFFLALMQSFPVSLDSFFPFLIFPFLYQEVTDLNHQAHALEVSLSSGTMFSFSIYPHWKA